MAIKINEISPGWRQAANQPQVLVLEAVILGAVSLVGRQQDECGEHFWSPVFQLEFLVLVVLFQEGGL